MPRAECILDHPELAEAEEPARFPGVFVKYRNRSGSRIAEDITQPINDNDNEKNDTDEDRVTINQDQDEYSSFGLTASSDFTSSLTTSSDFTASLTLSEDALSRPRRRRKKVKSPEENTAIDAVRYKTRMCKNFEEQQKCPYGPRCLFAHGLSELRSHDTNSEAITLAAHCQSPDRQFYAVGRFPSFMPSPFPELDNKESRSTTPPPTANIPVMAPGPMAYPPRSTPSVSPPPPIPMMMMPVNPPPPMQPCPASAYNMGYIAPPPPPAMPSYQMPAYVEQPMAPYMAQPPQPYAPPPSTPGYYNATGPQSVPYGAPPQYAQDAYPGCPYSGVPSQNECTYGAPQEPTIHSPYAI